LTQKGRLLAGMKGERSLGGGKVRRKDVPGELTARPAEGASGKKGTSKKERGGGREKLQGSD